MHDTLSASKTDGNVSIVEPLDKLSRFAFDWAETLCSKDLGCFDYHRMWTLVRLLESGGALPSGEDFFDAELPRVAKDGHVRVLLSGGADTGLLTLAANACLRAGLTPDVKMIDCCATPLEQCRILALQNGIQFEAVQGSADSVCVGPVDAIMAHSFLFFVPREARPALFRNWSRNLRLGGKVLMSQRLLAPDQQFKRERPADKIRERRERLAEALAVQNPVAADPNEILDAAERLWLHKMGGNGISLAEIESLCESSGFALESIQYDDEENSVSPFVLKSEALTRARANIALVKLREVV